MSKTNIFAPDQTTLLIKTLFDPDDNVTIRPIETWTDDSDKKCQQIDWQGYGTYSRDQLIIQVDEIGQRSHKMKTNLFFGVCPRISHDHQRAWQTRKVNCLWSDVDNVAPKDVLERCEKAGLPKPSIIVVSGNGCHLYWLLNEPILINDVPDPPPVLVDWNAPRREPRDKYFEIDGERTYVSREGKYIRHPHPITILSEKAQQIQFAMQGIAAAIGGDHTHDLARLMRLPGTLNVKNVRNGQASKQCEIYELDAERRYNLEEFESFAALSPTKQKREELKRPGRQRRTQKRKDRFNNLLKNCDETQDRSKADFALICEAVKQGRDEEEVWNDVQDTSKFAERGRDYFEQTWSAAEEAVIDDMLEAAEIRESDCPYAATDSGMNWRKTTDFEVEEVPLTNFSATIVAEITVTDGHDEQKQFEIDAQLEGHSYRFTVPATEFDRLDWVASRLGARAVVYPGHHIRDHAMTAIKLLSTNMTKRIVHQHLGWRTINNRPTYLHAGGGINADGLTGDVYVEPHGSLANFEFPEPITDLDELKKAFSMTLEFLDVAPDSVTAPLLAAAYRSVLGSADFSVFLHGRTQSGKTELAALVQRHFGASMDATRLPLSWTSTDNALEGVCFYAKDALIVVDDFVTKGNRHEVSRQHTKAERLLRGQANQQGRSRMNCDSSLRATKYPRGLILSTGEEIPEGESLRARMYLVEVQKEDVDWHQMTQLQVQGGVFSRVMSTFIQWVAGNYDTVVGRLKERTNEIREEIRSSCGGLMRTPTVAAGLIVGAKMFVEFAKTSEALGDDEARKLYERLKDGILASSDNQRLLQADENDVSKYMRFLRAALDSGAGHLRGMDGNEPPMPKLWGWATHDDKPRPQGVTMGWVDKTDVYLNPEATFSVVQLLANKANDPISLKANTVGARLKEHGVLASSEDGRATVRRQVEGATRRLLHIDAATLGVTDQSRQQLTEKPELPFTGDDQFMNEAESVLS